MGCVASGNEGAAAARSCTGAEPTHDPDPCVVQDLQPQGKGNAVNFFANVQRRRIECANRFMPLAADKDLEDVPTASEKDEECGGNASGSDTYSASGDAFDAELRACYVAKGRRRSGSAGGQTRRRRRREKERSAAVRAAKSNATSGAATEAQKSASLTEGQADRTRGDSSSWTDRAPAPPPAEQQADERGPRRAV